MIKILLATLSGTVVYFLFGWLVFEYILGSYMTANTTQIAGFKKTEEESSLMMLVVSCAAYALLLTLILGEWAQKTTFKEGALVGAVVGILVAIMTNAYWYSSSHFFNSLKPVFTDVLAAGLTVGFMGGTIGWVLGYWQKS
jgi:hypothetical protein